MNAHVQCKYTPDILASLGTFKPHPAAYMYVLQHSNMKRNLLASITKYVTYNKD